MTLSSDLRDRAQDAALHILRNSKVRTGLDGSAIVLPEPETQNEGLDDDAAMVERASTGLLALSAYCKKLERYIEERESWTNSEIRALEDLAQEWERAAAEADDKARALERQRVLTERRVEAAERGIQAEREALAFLRRRIDAAFGTESEADRTIRSIEPR